MVAQTPTGATDGADPTLTGEGAWSWLPNRLAPLRAAGTMEPSTGLVVPEGRSAVQQDATTDVSALAPLEQARHAIGNLVVASSHPGSPGPSAVRRAKARAYATLVATCAWLRALGMMHVEFEHPETCWPARTPLSTALSTFWDSPTPSEHEAILNALIALSAADASTWFAVHAVLGKQAGIITTRRHAPELANGDLIRTHFQDIVSAIAIHDLLNHGEDGAAYRQALAELKPLPSVGDAWPLAVQSDRPRGTDPAAEPPCTPVPKDGFDDVPAGDRASPEEAPPDHARERAPARGARNVRAAPRPKAVRASSNGPQGRAAPEPLPVTAPVTPLPFVPLHYATAPEDWANGRVVGQGAPGHWLRVSCWDGLLVENGPGTLLREIAGTWVAELAEAFGIPVAQGAMRAEGEREGSSLESVVTPSGVLRVVATDAHARGRAHRMRLEVACTPCAEAHTWQVRLERFVMPGTTPLPVVPLHHLAEAFFRRLATAGAVLHAGGRLCPSGHYLVAEDLPSLADRFGHPEQRRTFLCIRGGHDVQEDIARWIEQFAGWTHVFVLRTHALAARLAMQIGQPEVQREQTVLAYDVAPGRAGSLAFGAPLAAPREQVRCYAGAMMQWLEAEAPPNPSRTGADVLTSSLIAELHETRNQLREQEAARRLDRERAAAAEADAAALRATIERMKIQLSGLTERNARLEDAVKAARPALASWDDLEAWCAQALRGRIVLTQKAMQAARRSAFTDYTLAADVLELLGQDYTDMRRGVAGARERCEARQLMLGVDIRPTGDAVHHHRYKSEYQAYWGKRAYRLDLHVSGHSARDRSRCFRLYFAWASEHALVVVGSFPEHLTNRGT